MSVLDRVYTTFNRLDQDFARSKKTRTEFITDKFGGDINIGAIIILDAIRAENAEETPENIAKMSFVKDTFTQIQACADRLDTLSSFDFANTNVLGSFLDILSRAEGHASGQTIVDQAGLWANKSRAAHFLCTPDGTAFVPLDDCKVYSVYNENMAGLVNGVFKMDRAAQLGDYYKVLPGRRLKQIQEGAVAKNLK